MSDTHSVPERTKDILRTLHEDEQFNKVLNYNGFSILYFNRYFLGDLVAKYFVGGEDPKLNEELSGVLKITSRYNLQDSCRTIARSFLGKALIKLIRPKYLLGDKNKIMIVSNLTFWKYYPTKFALKKENYSDQDTTLGTIIDSLKTMNINIIALDVDSSFFVDWKTTIEKSIHSKGLWRPVESFLTFNMLSETYKQSNDYRAKWKQFRNENSKSLIIKINDKHLIDLLLNYFDKFFNNRIFLSILYVKLLEKAIEYEKPSLILISCVECMLGSAAVIAGKNKKIKTIDIQHGIIHPHHWGYIYSKESSNAGLEYRPIPDKTFVYGEYFKSLLTNESIYPKDDVIAAGSTRNDVLYQLSKFYSKDQFLNKYGITRDNKIVLWATAFQGQSESENESDVKALIEALRNESEILLLIKPHPLDTEKQVKIIKENIDKHKIKCIIFERGYDTYELLFACDLMITKNSTTAMEALVLDKPIIILNLTGKSDPIEYVNEGVAKAVYSPDQLGPTIHKLLINAYDLELKRNNYIKKYLYKFDGKSTQRIVNYLHQILDDS